MRVHDNDRVTVECPNGCTVLKVSYRTLLHLYRNPLGLVDVSRMQCPDCLSLMLVEVRDSVGEDTADAT